MFKLISNAARRALYRAGVGYSDIARKLGCTQRSVWGWAQIHPTDDDRAERAKHYVRKRGPAPGTEKPYTRPDGVKPAKLCGDCKNWLPDVPVADWDKIPRIDDGVTLPIRDGRCGRDGNRRERCDRCGEETGATV